MIVHRIADMPLYYWLRTFDPFASGDGENAICLYYTTRGVGFIDWSKL